MQAVSANNKASYMPRCLEPGLRVFDFTVLYGLGLDSRDLGLRVKRPGPRWLGFREFTGKAL